MYLQLIFKQISVTVSSVVFFFKTQLVLEVSTQAETWMFPVGTLTKFVLYVLKKIYFVTGKNNNNHDPFSGITLYFWQLNV